MATITGLTAERLLQLEADTVIGGHVDGENLILEQHDGSTINAGNVRGFPGISDMDLYDPVGVPKPYMGAAAPTGYGLCDAVAEYDGVLYPQLAEMFGVGVACINGPSSAGQFRLPNLKGKILVGRDAAVGAFDTLHEIGGNKDAVAVTHDHAADQAPHDHAADQAAHDHGGTVSQGGLHTHSVDGGDFGDRIVVTYGTPGASFLDSASGFNITYSRLDNSPTHDHNIPASDPAISVSSVDPAISVAAGGVSGVDKNMPPYRIVNWIMRLA